MMRASVFRGGQKLALNHRPLFTTGRFSLVPASAFEDGSILSFLFLSFFSRLQSEAGNRNHSETSYVTKGLSLEPLDHGWPELRTQQGYSAILLFAFHWIQSVFTLMLPLGPYCEMKSLILSLRWWNAILRLYSNNNNCLFQICVIV